MRFGFYLPTRGPTSTPEGLTALVQRAEQLGFTSTMIGDHVVFPVTVQSPYPYTASGVFPGGGDALEQFTLMTFVAAKTSTLRLVSSVLIVPQRNPLVSAKTLATLDVLSGGRVTVGVGVGWMREEFEALGVDSFDRRGSVTDEYLRIFKLLWTTSPASYSGEFYRFEALRCLPLPVQKPHPPIWIGGSSRPALRRTARFGDGWHPVGANPGVPLPPEELVAMRDELFRMVDAEGRDPQAISVCYKVPVSDPTLHDFYARSAERPPFSGSPEQVVEDIEAYAKIGVHELVFDVRRPSLDESLERMERFGEVIRLAKST
jgi:probable F420-dependent oxidoreductase